MSANTLRPATFILKKAGFDLPADFLTAAITPDVTCGGIAIQEVDEDENPFLYTERSDDPIEASDILEMLVKAKDKSVVIWLGRGSVPTESVQPFIYQVSGEDALAIFVEGDFGRYEATAELSAEHVMVNKEVLPNLARAFKYADGDADKFFAELNDDTFKNNLLNTVGFRGAFAFLPGVGDPILFGKNELAGEFDWGMCSQVQDLVKTEEPAPAEVVAEQPKKKGGFLGKAKAAAQAAVASASGAPAVKSAEPAAPQNTEKPPAIVNQPADTPPKTDTKVMVPIPGNLTQKEKHAFIKKHLGHNPPKGWKNMKVVESRVPAETPKPTVVKDTKEIAAAVSGKSTVREPYVADAATKETEPRASVSEEAAKFLLTAKEKEEAGDFILKHLDFTSQEISAPQDIQKTEAKYGSFSKQVGFDIERVFQWKTDRLEEFLRKNSKFGFLLCLELRRMAQVNNALTVKDVVGTATNVAPATGQKTAPVAEPAPAAAAPVKKGGFLKKKAA